MWTVYDVAACSLGQNREKAMTELAKERKGLLLTILQNEFAYKKVNLREISRSLNSLTTLAANLSNIPRNICNFLVKNSHKKITHVRL